MSIAARLMAALTALTTVISGGGELRKPTTPEPPAAEEWLSPTELCEEIVIGWNLGNTLDATGGSGLSSETSWGNPKAAEELILAVKEAGFNAVRIPTTWYNHCSGSEYTIDSEWLDRVQEVVDYAYDNDLYVILNAHHENFNFPSDENYPKAKKALTCIWKQVAERFADYGERLIFEGQNEPRKVGTNVEWNGGDYEGRKNVNKLNADFVATVRATGGNNEKRCLMIPTYAASFYALDGFELPDDDRLIVSIHAYSPYNFAMNTGNWATDNFDPNDSNSTSELVTMADTLYDRFVSKGVGVIIGECGATNKGNAAQRLNWAKYFPACFGKKGIPVFLWDNHAFGTGGEKFGLINRYSLTWEYPDYIKALVNSAEKA